MSCIQASKYLRKEYKAFFAHIVVAEEKEKNMQNAIIDIKRRFGKNSLIKAMSLQEKATGIRRNNMVGGHNGG